MKRRATVPVLVLKRAGELFLAAAFCALTAPVAESKPAPHIYLASDGFDCAAVCRYPLVNGVPSRKADLRYSDAYPPVAVDSSGRFYAYNINGTAIDVYPPNSHKVEKMLLFPRGFAVEPLALAVAGDNAYLLYVDAAWPVDKNARGLPCGEAGIIVLDVRGIVAPWCFPVDYDFVGPATVAVSNGELYIPNQFSVSVYAGLTGTPYEAGRLTGESFQYAKYLAIDPDGHPYLLNVGRYVGMKQYSYVAAYAAGKLGQVVPQRTIAYPTLRKWDGGIAVDDTYVYVSDKETLYTYGHDADGRMLPWP